MSNEPRIPHGASPVHQVRGGPGTRGLPHGCAEILRESFLCHVAHYETSTVDGNEVVRPKCVPMVYSYDEHDQALYLHGSIAYPTAKPLPSLKHLWHDDGVPVCVNITLVDGIAVGRAAISTSLAYRSVVVDGVVKKVGPEGREKAIKSLSDQVIPGRWGELRPLEGAELDTDGKATPTVGALSLSLTESTTVVGLKQRDGTIRHERDEDRKTHPWAGELPIIHTFGKPKLDVGVDPKTPLPPSVQALIDKHKPT